MQISSFLIFLKWLLTGSLLTALLGVGIDYFYPIRIIGLTGSIACGKSTVAKYMRKSLRKRGTLSVIDFDKLGHKALDAGCKPHALVRERFGAEVLRNDWTIDREVLGDIVFDDKTKLKFLNSAVRPQIIMLFVWELLKCVIYKRRSIIVLDAPLLFESGLYYFCDKTIAVIVEKDAQIARLIQRDNCEIELALNKINSQMSSEDKGRLADVQINNNGDMQQLKDSVEVIMQKKPFNLSDRGLMTVSCGKFPAAIALIITILALTFHIPEIFFTIIVALTILVIEIFVRVR